MKLKLLYKKTYEITELTFMLNHEYICIKTSNYEYLDIDELHKMIMNELWKKHRMTYHEFIQLESDTYWKLRKLQERIQTMKKIEQGVIK